MECYFVFRFCELIYNHKYQTKGEWLTVTSPAHWSDLKNCENLRLIWDTNCLNGVSQFSSFSSICCCHSSFWKLSNNVCKQGCNKSGRHHDWAAQFRFLFEFSQFSYLHTRWHPERLIKHEEIILSFFTPPFLFPLDVLHPTGHFPAPNGCRDLQDCRANRLPQTP